ncbi:MAG: hypothetical protein ACI30A_03155 [Paludibacteraceae bacterium]
MKKMFLLLSLVAALTVTAQDTQYLPISVLVEEAVEPLPATAQVQMQNKLSQVLAKNGIASMDYLGQFFLTAFVVPQTKDIVPGPPMKISETMEMTFYIADYTNKLVFATTTATVRGIGETESKCYMNAIRNLNPTSPALTQFVQEGRQKIVDYYNAEADNIIKKAQFLASTKQYEEALSLVVTIPAQCKKYDESLREGLAIYQQYIDYKCQVNLVAARQAWAAEQNARGAQAAGEYLAQIYPDAGCYDEAMALYKEIKSKVLDDWKFEMKVYQDGVDIEKAKINAMREVGVAFGRGQQPTTTNIGFLR